MQRVNLAADYYKRSPILIQVCYHLDFEDLIIPLYNDDNISLNRKKELIQDYINVRRDINLTINF